MIGDDDEAGLARLRAALDRWAIPVEEVEREVVTAFGDPLLIVATGSILAGFGNRESDVDLFVLVDSDDVLSIPVVSFRDGARIDGRFFARHESEAWPDLLAYGGAPKAGRGEAGALQVQAVFDTATRFALGYPLAGTDPWRAWRHDLRRGPLGEQVVGYWTAQAVRRAFTLRLLDPAAQPHRMWATAQATLRAAYELYAARRGQVFFGDKWIGEKLVRLGATELSARLGDVLGAAPGEAGRLRALALDEAARVVAEDGTPGPWQVELQTAAGVRARTLAGRTLVTRWELRGVELLDATIDDCGPGTELWRGAPDDTPPPHLTALVREDMLWTDATLC